MTTKNKSGFQRLRGVAAAGVAATAGLFGAAGSARAATTDWSTITIAAVPAINGWDAIWSFGSSSSAYVSELTLTNGTSYRSDGLDGALYLAVDGNWYENPEGVFDVTDGVATYPTQENIVPGVNAGIEYRFFDQRAAVRAVYTLTNTTGAPITINAAIFGDVGSDGSTTVQRSSDGNLTADDSDLWTITSDQDVGVDSTDGDDPVMIITRHGAGARVTGEQSWVFGDGDDEFQNEYAITIPANSTVRLLAFIEGTATLAQAKAQVSAYNDIGTLQAAGLLEGLSAEEIASVVNYGGGGGYVSGFGSGTGSVGGGGALPAGLLVGLAGLLALRVRRKQA